MKSFSLITSANKKADCNKLMEALGRGPNTFRVDLSPSGARVETHHGAHTYDDALLAIIESKALPTGVDWLAYGLNALTALDALLAIKYLSRANRASVANFEAHATAQGVKVVRDVT